MLLIIFSHPFTGNSQTFIGDSPGHLKKKLEKYAEKNAVSYVFTQTDSSITMRIQDPRLKPAEFIFLFGQNKCVEEIKLSCDSCVMKYVNEALLDKSMGWQKMNDSSYLAKFSKHRMMTVHVNGNASSLRIRKLYWDKKAYQNIVKSLSL